MPQAAFAQQFFLMVMIIGIFYFIVIVPQRKKDKAHQKMMSTLSKNDEVVTSAGIHGTVVNVKDKTVVLRVDDNVKIEMEKSCIAFIGKAQGTEPKQGA